MVASLTKDLQTEPKKVLCVGVVRQTHSVWFMRTNDQYHRSKKQECGNTLHHGYSLLGIYKVTLRALMDVRVIDYAMREYLPPHNFCIYFYNRIFHYTLCITPKRATSLRGLFPYFCVRLTQLLSKKCCSDGEPFTTLCRI